MCFSRVLQVNLQFSEREQGSGSRVETGVETSSETERETEIFQVLHCLYLGFEASILIPSIDCNAIWVAFPVNLLAMCVV